MTFRIAGAVLAIACVLAGCQHVPGAPSPLFTVWTNTTPPPPPPPPPIPHVLYTRILAFGDSMTEGDSTPDAVGYNAADCPVRDTPGLLKSYPYKLGALMAARYQEQTISVFNGGCGGERADVAAARLAALIDLLHPEILILMEGANDLNEDQDAAVSTASQAMDQLVKLAQARGVRVILSTLPLQNPNGTPPRGASSTLVQPFNAKLAQVAAANLAILADIHAVVTLEMLAPDGLHLTQAGNDAIAAVYMTRIREAFEVPLAASARSGGA